MKKKIGFIGNAAGSAPGSKDNTGNNVHGHAARDLFNEWSTIRSQPSDENIAKLRSEITHLGFIAATMLHTRKPPSYIEGHVNAAAFVEKLDLPVVAFGFGCHAMLNETVADAQVDARSVRLLQVLAERADTVGVRGEFTADLCAKYGVKNVTVVGCQSAYIAGVLNFRRRDLTTSCDRPAINVSLGPDERQLLRLGMAADAGIIGQGDTTEESITEGSLTRDQFINDSSLWVFPYLQRAFSENDPTRGQYYDYINRNFHKFYTVPTWRAFMAENYDFCLGTRFHGNMAAFQAGVPAMWVIHDLRTKELCDHLNLPSIMSSELLDYSDIKQVANACSYETFWKKLPQRINEFQAYLDGNGVGELLAPWVKSRFEAIRSSSSSMTQ